MHGNFVVSKTAKLHSIISVDQAHEQHNTLLKSVAWGLELLNTDDDGVAVLLWIISSPEILRITKKYEDHLDTNPRTSSEHHESYSAFQMDYVADVLKLTNCIETSFKNPFSDIQPQLLYLNTGKEIANSQQVSLSLWSMILDEKKLYNTFVSEKLVICSVPLTLAIKRNHVSLPSNCKAESDIIP